MWPCEIWSLRGCYSGSISPYLDRSVFPCKFSLLVLHFICISLRSVHTSELQTKYFSALTPQSVNKCLLSYASMHLYHFFPTTTEQLQEFYVANFFESQNADAWFGFLISEGSKGRSIFIHLHTGILNMMGGEIWTDFKKRAGEQAKRCLHLK